MSKPKFNAGDTVVLVSDDGLNHRDKVGQLCDILWTSPWLLPDDEPEYATTFGFGFIRERRLISKSEYLEKKQQQMEELRGEA
jgi:hypothetical protein